MVDVPRPRWHVRRRDAAARRAQQRVVLTGALAALLVPAREVAQLDGQDAGLDGVETAVGADELVDVLPRLTVVAHHAAITRQLLVIRGDRAGFAAGAEVLARIEAPGRRAPHRPGLPPRLVLAREVLRPMR